MPASSATLHVLRLDEPVGPRQVLRPSVPGGATAAIVGTSVTFDGGGGFEPDPTRVQALVLWDDDGARGEHLRRAVEGDDEGLPGAAEAWHAALVPYRHHGAVDLAGRDARRGRGPDPDEALFAADPDRGPGGAPIVTMTTTGFHPEPERALALGRALHEVQDRLDGAEGLLRHAVSLGRRDHDGRTFLLWRDEAAAVSWAYRSPPHEAMPARQRAEDLMPRSSFTRFTIAEAHGTWDGTDPLADPAVDPVGGP